MANDSNSNNLFVRLTKCDILQITCDRNLVIGFVFTCIPFFDTLYFSSVITLIDSPMIYKLIWNLQLACIWNEVCYLDYSKKYIEIF